MHASTEPNAEEAAQVEMVLAYFDGDRPVFRPAAIAAAEDDAILEDESSMAMPPASATTESGVAGGCGDRPPLCRSRRGGGSTRWITAWAAAVPTAPAYRRA
ncbi:hypothetical protein T492DRAFT_869828 [Pavlovales sp. CCMP2436]|nr:hypothetical protein T492DRAFT_869828 [Pavlovales sp. CCMP2436]